MLVTFLCSFAFVGAYVFVVGMIATGFTNPPLPDWAKGPILEWMFDVPQKTGTDYYPNEGLVTMFGPSDNSKAGNGGSQSNNAGGGGRGGGAHASGSKGENTNSGNVFLSPGLSGPLQGSGIRVRGPGSEMAYYPGSCCVKWNGYLDAIAALPNGVPFKGLKYVPLGCRFHDKYYKTHTGQDFPVPEDTPIYSTMEGQVVYAGRDGPYGNLVVVENGDYQVWFAHQDHFNVQVGDIVQAGDLIGWSDSTGNSTGPHVHYAILYNNPDNGNQYWLDPLNFFDPASVTDVGC